LFSKGQINAFFYFGEYDESSGLVTGRQSQPMRHTAKYLLKRYSFYLGGDQPLVSWAERLRAFGGALFFITGV
jgi:hypothetical protein